MQNKLEFLVNARNSDISAEDLLNKINVCINEYTIFLIWLWHNIKESNTENILYELELVNNNRELQENINVLQSTFCRHDCWQENSIHFETIPYIENGNSINIPPTKVECILVNKGIRHLHEFKLYKSNVIDSSTLADIYNMSNITEFEKMVTGLHELDDKANFEVHFHCIAKCLMDNFAIKINEDSYDIVEIEFYYNSKNHHDKYVHHKIENEQMVAEYPIQYEHGKWYCHGSGLDITIGNKKKNAFGGILIRGIKNKKDENPIYGPWKIRTEIFTHFNSVFDKKCDSFELTEESESSKKCYNILNSTRIRLKEEKDTTDNKKYYTAKYRFVAYQGNWRIPEIETIKKFNK